VYETACATACGLAYVTVYATDLAYETECGLEYDLVCVMVYDLDLNWMRFRAPR